MTVTNPGKPPSCSVPMSVLPLLAVVETDGIRTNHISSHSINLSQQYLRDRGTLLLHLPIRSTIIRAPVIRQVFISGRMLPIPHHFNLAFMPSLSTGIPMLTVLFRSV